MLIRRLNVWGSLGASFPFYMMSEAKCKTTRQRGAKHTPLALASPFVCYSRVTSRDSPKWRACSRAFFDVARETGSVSCRIALWDCFGDAIAAFVGNYEVAQETGPRIFVPKNSPMVQFDTTPTQSHTQSNVSSSKGANYLVWRWCYTRLFATTIFSATQRCDIVSNGYNIVPTLQRCVGLKIVVANRTV